VNIYLAAQQSCSGLDRLIIEILRSHTKHTLSDSSARGIGPSQKPLIWQHTTFARDRHPCPGGIWIRNPSKRAAAVVCLRLRGYRDRRVQ